MAGPTASAHPPAPGLGRLLLATEHTEQDRGAEAVAFGLAQADPLPSLRTVMPLASNPEYETTAPETAARAEAELGRRRDALQAAARAAGAPLDLHVRRGSDPAAEIVAEAAERAADLLVIRRRGQRGRLAQLLIGEMVSRVLAQAPCSVLVVPREAGMWRRAVLACVDAADEAGATRPAATDLEMATAVRRPSAVVAWAARAAAAASVPLHLVCTVASAAERERGERALARAHDEARTLAAAAGHGVPISTALRIGPALGHIVASATEFDADLVVLARGGGQLLGRAWIGELAEKVIGQASCPVLAVVPARSGAGSPAAAR